MRWSDHSALSGSHAFLSPSSYHWINYDDQKLEARYHSHRAAKRGTDLHQLAHDHIRLGIKMPRTNKTIDAYVNDAIGYKMRSEQPLFYSPNCFGTPDAMSFRKEFLRIHDLKTGITPSSIRQLEVYAALFCLEYGVNPEEIDIELRIYQRDEVIVHVPVADHIRFIMDKIIDFDQKLEQLKEGDPWS